MNGNFDPAAMRAFFTPDEIEEIKNRVVETIVTAVFLDKKQTNRDGEKYTSYRVKGEIDDIIRNETRRIFSEYVERVANETVREKIEESAAKMAERLAKQVGEIADKVNWYWSIK